MLVVDGSVWVSRYLPAEETHDSSREWLERYFRAGGQLVEPMLLLVELAAAISRRTGAADIALETAQQLTRLRSIRFVAVDRRLGAMATQIAADRRLRGADAIYAAVASRLGIPLLTWDREQLERSGGFIRTATPDEIEPIPAI
jgi:predicted nucleic acid-binding protein